jgi:hypothetical protein
MTIQRGRLAMVIRKEGPQELLRHSTLRSTLDVYTQAITPAKHAAQAAVLSLVFSHEAPAAVICQRRVTKP